MLRIPGAAAVPILFTMTTPGTGTHDQRMAHLRFQFGGRIVAAVALATVMASSAAESTEQAVQASGKPAGSPDRFGRHEDSFVVWNHMRNNGWADNDDGALRAHYSFKYSFCGPILRRKGAPADSDPQTQDQPVICPTGGLLSGVELFAAYTGEFDFYWGTRTSSPVINRLSAPGLFVRIPMKEMPARWFGDGWNEYDNLELGYEHRSNGQVVDVLSPSGAAAAQAKYTEGNRPYFDTVSRDANYFSLTLDRRDPLGASKVDLRAKLRLYTSQDSAVTWGPLANSGRRFSNYDRLELRASYRLAESSTNRVEVEWRVGDKGLATDSWTFGLLLNWGEVPFYLRVHRGPMNTLSNYTQVQNSVGLGLLLARL